MYDEYEDDGDASCDALLRFSVVFCGEEEMFGAAQCACVRGLFNLIHCSSGSGGGVLILRSGGSCRRGFR